MLNLKESLKDHINDRFPTTIRQMNEENQSNICGKQCDIPYDKIITRYINEINLKG